MAVTIRLLGPADAQQKRQLRLEMLALHPDAFTSDAAQEAQRPLDWTEERLTPSEAKPHDLWVGAFDGTELVGCAGLAGHYRAKEFHNATLVGMMVHPRARGQGVGRRLLDAVLEHARRIPTLTHLDLSVTQGNAHAQRLYEAAGFTVYGVHPDAIRVQGRFYAKVLMARTLRDHP